MQPASTSTQWFPSWLPLRHNHDGGSFKVSCVKSNCDNGTYHGYWAVDFSDPTGKAGAPVYAAGPGQVVAKDASHSACGGQGTPANYVNIDHGSGVVSRYLHLSSVTVGVGDWVDQNTQVGTGWQRRLYGPLSGLPSAFSGQHQRHPFRPRNVDRMSRERGRALSGRPRLFLVGLDPISRSGCLQRRDRMLVQRPGRRWRRRC